MDFSPEIFADYFLFGILAVRPKEIRIRMEHRYPIPTALWRFI